MSTENIEVLGCGCRYRINPIFRRCEHLCDIHKNEYILKSFNEQLVAGQISDAKIKRGKLIDKINRTNNNNNNNNRIRKKELDNHSNKGKNQK